MFESILSRENLRKIHLGSVLAALILFFVPWVDVRCSGDQMMSQNGVQVIYGGATVPPGLRAMIAEESEKPGKQDTAGIGWLAGVAFLSLLAAVAWALYDFRLTAPGGTKIVGGLCALSLIFLLGQLAFGFPVEKVLVDAMGKSAKASEAEDFPFPSLKTGNSEFDTSMRKAEREMERSMAQTTKGLNAAMAMAFTVHTRFWFFLELLALSIPAGLRIRELVVAKSLAVPPFHPRPILKI